MSGTDASTAAFYAAHPWPGPNAIVSRKWALRLKSYVPEGQFRFLDAGCGSGQYATGMLLEYPQSRAIAIDLSENSLRDTQSLLKQTGTQDRADVQRRSFSEPLGWDDSFDIAIANGSLHHSPNPAQSLVNVAKSLKVGGVLGCMVYGDRSNARRYELKELLHLLGGGDPETMYRLYLAFDRSYGSLLDKTPRTLYRNLKNWIGRRLSRLSGTESSWGYDPFADRKQAFIDGYLAPIDVAFSSRQLAEMLSQAGLDLCEMLTMGRPDETMLPAEWRPRWRALSRWDQIRVSELATPFPMSLSFIARRVR